jgi:hypothetical protein
MKITCRLEFVYDSEKEAMAILKATEVDNYQFIRTEREGKILRSIVTSESIPSLLHTMDDYLACVCVAENLLKEDSPI